jgi:hypothetical protein
VLWVFPYLRRAYRLFYFHIFLDAKNKLFFPILNTYPADILASNPNLYIPSRPG